MKIIGIDNLNRDNISDILICENVNEYYANKFIEVLNFTRNQPYFYQVVADDYKLYVFEGD